MMMFMVVPMIVVMRMPMRSVVWLERRRHFDALEPMLRDQ